MSSRRRRYSIELEELCIGFLLDLQDSLESRSVSCLRFACKHSSTVVCFVTGIPEVKCLPIFINRKYFRYRLVIFVDSQRVWENTRTVGHYSKNRSNHLSLCVSSKD